MAELTFVEKYFKDEGIAEGETQWRRSEKLDTARRLRKMGLSDNDIFRATELPLEEISAIRQHLTIIHHQYSSVCPAEDFAFI